MLEPRLLTPTFIFQRNPVWGFDVMEVLIVLDDSSDESKDGSAEAIGKAAAMLEADFIFQIREAWMLPTKYVARHEAIVEKYGSIGASPYAQDVVAFSLETPTGLGLLRCH